MVHAAAIAAVSEQLNALINGGMEESEKRCAKIEDVRVDDFIRFCEYAYRGDYTVPPWEEVPPEPSSSADGNLQNGLDDDWGFRVIGTSTGKKKMSKVALRKARMRSEHIAAPEPTLESDIPVAEAIEEYDEPQPESPSDPYYDAAPISRTPLRTRFNNRTYLSDGDPKGVILEHFKPEANTSADQNFTPVLLAHARLYCFAHLRLIAPLKALTLEKLHTTLMEFKLFTKRVGDITELARFAYSDPDLPDRKDDGTIDELRKLVVEYIVCEIDTIGKCDKFMKYMEEGGEFVGDFWRMAREYMV